MEPAPTVQEPTQQDYRVLLDNAPDAIARFDRQLRHVYVNEATARENNRPISDFHLKTMEELGHPPEICDLINRNLRTVFEDGTERTFELRFNGPHGTRWFQCRMAPEWSEGEVRYVIVMSRDISESRRLEISLRAADKKNEAAALTARLAHEINNPLAILVNTIYLLERNPSLDDSAAHAVEIARDAVNRISGISRQMLHIYGEEPDAF